MNFENCIGYRRPRQMIVPHTFTVSHDAFSSRICLRVESGKEFRFFVSRRLLPSCLFSFLIWFCQFNAIGRFIAAHTQQFCLSERRCVECRIMFVRARCTVSTTTQWNAFFWIWRRKKGGNTWHAHVFLSFIDSSCFFFVFRCCWWTLNSSAVLRGAVQWNIYIFTSGNLWICFFIHSHFFKRFFSSFQFGRFVNIAYVFKFDTLPDAAQQKNTFFSIKPITHIRFKQLVFLSLYLFKISGKFIKIIKFVFS